MSDSIKFFKPLDSMLNTSCEFCGKNNPQIDVLVQENIPGGGMLLAHQACLDKFIEEIQNDANISR